MRGAARRALVFLAVVLLAGPTTADAGKPVLVAAHAEARPADDGAGYRVHLTYEILHRGARQLELSALAPGAELPQLLEARVDDEPRSLSLAVTGPRLTSSIRLPDSPSGKLVRIRFDYEVPRALERDGARVELRLPLVVVHCPPEPTGHDAFRARVTLPPSTALSGSFPVGFRSAAADEDGAVYEVSLPVVPAFLTLRGSTAGTPLLTIGRMTDLAAVVLLIGFGLLGWRRFRGGLS